MEIRPSFFIGGKYPNSPMRHKSSNCQTLKDLMTSQGYLIVDDPFEADIFLSIDFNLENEVILRTRKTSGKFNELLRSEPRCVLPEGYSRKALTLNDHIITFGKPELSSTSEVWPQFWEESPAVIDHLARNGNRAVIVNANKLNLSKGELYTLRRKCIKKIENLHLFGSDWNISLIARSKVAIIEVLKDPIRNLFFLPLHSKYWFSRWPRIDAPIIKEEVLRDFQVSLVIENELTYLSEKLFDALCAGCIPVYVGPDISRYEIPPSLVLQAEPNLSSIKSQLEFAFGLDYEQYQIELQEWLESSKVIDRHSGEKVMIRALEKCSAAYSEFSNKNRR